MKASTLPRQQLRKLLAEDTASREQILNFIELAKCLVIGIGMLKGGTGKTTSTIFLALYLHIALGLKVAVIDTDDNSQSVEAWTKLRTAKKVPEDIPFDVYVYSTKVEDDEAPQPLDELIADLKDEGYQAILVDIGGAGKQEYLEMCAVAHMVLLPVAPSGFEISRIAATIKQASRAGKFNELGLKVFVTLVKCDNRTSLPEEGRAAVNAVLAGLGGIPGAEVYHTDETFQISNSPDYPRSWNTTPKLPQLEEFGFLFRHVMKAVAV